MNAICALFHFCEIHGPRTVFCTQAFHAHAKTSPPGTPSDHSPPSSPTSSRPNSGSSTHNLRHPQTGTSPKDAPDSDARAYCVKPPISPSPSLLLGTSSCPACAAQIPFITITNPDGSEWTQEAKGFYTEDDEDENVHYFGSRSPRDSRLYAAESLLNRDSNSSLSIEFYPNREGPVLFGDDKNGYVFSYMFKVRDSQARGETRYYSFIMLMTDCAYLASCWPFLVGAFRSMAMNLQEKAEMIYQREKEAKERQQALVMTGRRTSFGPSPGSVGLTGHVSTDQFLRNRRAATSLRSFVDLLNIKDLYVHMHGQFSWILKAASRRRMEKVVQGRRGRRRAIHEQDEVRMILANKYLAEVYRPRRQGVHWQIPTDLPCPFPVVVYLRVRIVPSASDARRRADGGERHDRHGGAGRYIHEGQGDSRAAGRGQEQCNGNVGDIGGDGEECYGGD
ncbi:vesicle coat protein [Jimgerdemannia flammicorona]|uniref:Vesicle coat protein n=1 Tax=Jimgerdemannia flammicorona TaxID=994334 RepID=A0A432ZZL3_9FUNG|nr:vesicle coat protein [Jimgerdemannia flammicorona]